MEMLDRYEIFVITVHNAKKICINVKKCKIFLHFFYDMLLKLKKYIYIMLVRFEKPPKGKGGNGVEKIKEKYTLLQHIGYGQSCKVYLAEHKKIHYTCVVKCIRKAEQNSDTILGEIQFLKHPNTKPDRVFVHAAIV